MDADGDEQAQIPFPQAFTTAIDLHGKAKSHSEATAAAIRALVQAIWSGPPRAMAVTLVET
jgi:hypothetical protein